MILGSLFFASASPAQPVFRAFASSVEQVEGGKIPTMVVLFGAERVTVRVPQGYGAQVQPENRATMRKRSEELLFMSPHVRRICRFRPLESVDWPE